MKTKIIPRYYQEEAINKAEWSLKKFKDNSLIIIPTGGGKSIVTAGIADRFKEEMLILQPSVEILEQNMNKLLMYVPEDEVGVYSAAFKRKDINKYNFATIQSVYKKPELFKHIPIVQVDEADLLNQKNKKGMFTSFLAAIGKPKTIGLTATPWRNVPTLQFETGEVLTSLKLINRMNPRMWNRIIYNINHKELLEQGYLSPIIYDSRTFIEHKKIPVNKSKSDFNLEAFEKLLTPFEGQIIESINKARKVRKAVLVFCSSVEQAERMAQTISNSTCISAQTKNRDVILRQFKTGVLDVVFNVGVLTVGFDFPELDTIYNLRPTRSLRLWMQMLGRGVRIAEGKKNCIVIDYSGTYDVLGPIADVRLVKEDNKWELYAKGEAMHNKALFSYKIDPKNLPKGNIKFGTQLKKNSN